MQVTSVNRPLTPSNPRPADRLSALKGSAAAPNAASAAVRKRPAAAQAIAGALSPVLLDVEPVIPGAALYAKHLNDFWVWFARDVAPEFASDLDLMIAAEPDRAVELFADAAAMIVSLSEGALAAAETEEQRKRVAVQLGGNDVLESVPAILSCVAQVKMLHRAAEFGGVMGELDSARRISLALQSVELPKGSFRRYWCLAAIGSIPDPFEFIGAMVMAAESDTEADLKNAGLGIWMDAFIIDAQRQDQLVKGSVGLFADVDLACKAIHRFHTIARAMVLQLELPANSVWGVSLKRLTKDISQEIEPKLEGVVRDVTLALRPARDGADRCDEDAVLQALNGLYLLATARDSRDSLAVNAVTERVWSQTGQTIETLLNRSIDALRDIGPEREVALRRVDAGIKMAGIRFGTDYAQVIERSRDVILRRHRVH